MKKLFTLILLSTGLVSCSSVQYSGKENLVNLISVGNDEAPVADSLSAKNKLTSEALPQANKPKVKSLGMISVARFDENGIARDPLVFNLRKEKSLVYAETKLFESENKDRSFFDEGMFDVGVDKSKMGVNMSFTFKY